MNPAANASPALDVIPSSAVSPQPGNAATGTKPLEFYAQRYLAVVAKLAAVRDLHQPMDSPALMLTLCHECVVPWPCPTSRALDGA